MRNHILHSILPVCLLILTACHQSVPSIPATLTKRADCPVARTSAKAFVVNDQVYVWSGRSEQQSSHNDIWTYDTEADQWTYAGKAPLKARVRATTCVVGESVYLGLGFQGQFLVDSSYLQDWWRYTPALDQWERLADYPNRQTVGAQAMTDGEHIYVAYGTMLEENRDVYCYDIRANQWSKMKDHVSGNRLSFPMCAQSACSADCQGRYFLGTGIFWECSNFWAEMTIDGDHVSWHKRAHVPGKGRCNAVACSDGQAIYLGGGRYWGGTVTDGINYKDILRYDIDKDQWTLIAKLPDGPRENMVAWSKGGKIYFGLGNDRYNRPCKELYCIEP